MKSLNQNYNYFFGIDFLRFLLAIIILVAHFPHFSSQFIPLLQLDRNSLPMYDILYLFYDYGGFAVQIFWMISGIIFYYFYNNLIYKNKLSFFSFLSLRFTKLYPVHFLTLFLVIIFQSLYYIETGKYFIYQNFDFTHFFLNLFMISYWNSRYGLSFNGPFWSVSVELFVYIIFYFFSFSKFLISNRIVKKIVILFFIFYSVAIISPFHECLLFFFVGVYLVSSKLLFFNSTLSKSISFLVITFIFFKFGFILFQSTNIIRVFEVLFKLSLSLFLILSFSHLFKFINSDVQTFFRTLSKFTYSIYMSHFTVQLFLILLFNGYSFEFFNSTSFFIFYLFLAIVFGIVIYTLVELPLQTLLRKRLQISFT